MALENGNDTILMNECTIRYKICACVQYVNNVLNSDSKCYVSTILWVHFIQFLMST